MSRGKWKSTLVKQAVGLAVLEAEAIMLATEKMKQKVHAKKSFFDSFREHIGKMIDRADPLEVAAILAATYLIQPIVKSSADFLSFANKHKTSLGIPGFFLPEMSQNLIGIGVPGFLFQKETIPQNPAVPPEPVDDNTVLSWILSFVIAYIAIKKGADILKSMGGLSGIIGLFGVLV